MLTDGYDFFESLLLLHYGLANGIPEKGFDFFTGPHHGHGALVAQRDNLGESTLLENERFYNHDVNGLRTHKITNILRLSQNILIFVKTTGIMKKILLFTLPLLMGACTSVVNPFPQEAHLYSLTSGQELTGPKAAREPAVYGTVETQLYNGPQAYSFVRFKASDYQLEVVNAPAQQADSTSALCLKHGALAGINGSYFDMGELTPVTYVKDDGFEVGSTTPGEFFRTNGAVLLDIDNVAIDATQPNTTWTGGEGWREVMASGPILLDEGQTVVYEEGIPHWKGFYAYRHPRSLVGADAAGYIWLLVVDGRSEGHADGMTIAELTQLAQSLGLTDALNLDGGGSSTLWTLPAGVINHPSDNGAFDAVGQRIVPNVLIVKPL
jgi:hypothetical protein